MSCADEIGAIPAARGSPWNRARNSSSSSRSARSSDCAITTARKSSPLSVGAILEFRDLVFERFALTLEVVEPQERGVAFNAVNAAEDDVEPRPQLIHVAAAGGAREILGPQRFVHAGDLLARVDHEIVEQPLIDVQDAEQKIELAILLRFGFAQLALELDALADVADGDEHAA